MRIATNLIRVPISPARLSRIAITHVKLGGNIMANMYIVTCPLCGKVLFKGKAVEHIEVQCPKCNGLLNVAMDGHQLIVNECSNDKRMKTSGKRLQTYQNEIASAL